MKICNEHLQALQQQEQARRKAGGNTGGFDELLSSELAGNEQMQDAASATPLPGSRAGFVSPLLLQGLGQAEAVSGTQSVTMGSSPLGAVMDDVSSLLDGCEAYANELANGGEMGLRSAYAMLDGLDTGVRSLRQKAPDLAGQHSGLDSMINEIEVMVAAEKFKLNRGDYLA